MTYGQKATEEENEAYRKHLCVECKEVRHSAGRPRCEECHKKYGSWHR